MVRLSPSRIRSPKLEPPDSGHVHPWYEYYAGYSAGFVEDLVNYLDLPSNATILDPWNGSGTTTFVSRELAFKPIGFDLNPALVLIATGRLLPVDILESIPPLTKDILAKARHLRKRRRAIITSDTDPLTRWFVADTAAHLRSLERAMNTLLIDGDTYLPLASASSLQNVSSLAAFFYVVLFRTVRTFVRRFKTTNPTWVTVPKDSRARLRIPSHVVRAAFRESQRSLSAHIRATARAQDATGTPFVINVAASHSLPLNDASIDAIVTSPPYCTRIDYVMATLPELAVLGYRDAGSLKGLRDSMLGTPTIQRLRIDPCAEWGPTCLSLLWTVTHHPSRASSTYYLRYFLQYFAFLFESLRELARVLRPTGYCALVVQDSYYKDIHVDLPTIVSEMAEVNGWCLSARFDFEVQATKASIHPGVRKYRHSFEAVESALIFRAATSPRDTRRAA